MPKSKTDKKRKKKVIAFKSKIQSDRTKSKNDFLKMIQEKQNREMEEQVNNGQIEKTDVNELSEFSLDNVQEVKLSDSPNDSFAGVIN